MRMERCCLSVYVNNPQLEKRRREHDKKTIGSHYIGKRDTAWMQDDIVFSEPFMDNAAKNFYAESYTVDFADPNVGKVVKEWIRKQAKGLLAPEVQTNPETLAILLNTVYFKANWVDKFVKSKAKNGEFHLSDGNTVSCDFMHQSGSAAPSDETIDMTLDRPFLYGVRDDDGTILFLGRCDDPS